MAIRNLQFLVREYEGVTKLIAQTKQRILALDIDMDAKHDFILGGEGDSKGLNYVKDAIGRKIARELKLWPLWERWMAKVPGIGPAIGGKLVLMYYYRFTPICQECGGIMEEFTCTLCGKAAKGDGLLKHRIDMKDFTCISSWWKYMGMHCAHDEKLDKFVKPKMRSGQKIDWNVKGRALGYLIGDQLMKQMRDKATGDRQPYRQFYDARRAKRNETHPDAKDGHKMNMARNETAKLFLAHMWTVARTLDGLPVSEPYAGAIMGHTNIIAPFYFENVKEKAA